MKSYCVDTVWHAVAPLNQPKWSIQPLEAAEEMEPLVRKGLYLGGESGWASSEHWAAAEAHDSPSEVQSNVRKRWRVCVQELRMPHPLFTSCVCCLIYH